MRIKFICPRCKSDRGVEEVVSSATVVSEVTEIEPDGGELTYGEVDHHDGEVYIYQCVNCGLPVGTSPKSMYEYLKEHGFLVE